LPGEFSERLGASKHFIGVAHYTAPAKLADSIDNFGWTRTAVGQVAAVEDEVGRDLPEVGLHRFERGPIAVDVGKYRDPHCLLPADSGARLAGCGGNVRSGESGIEFYTREPAPEVLQ